ncbi:MAG: hypothetical protein KIT72_16775 [Polyangiaceae bacterium]|nr:hypothetical protein [Polyangiaceae bacterium]MCW5792073.1 hypothetical protein [Polyangiaceae bacterium]
MTTRIHSGPSPNVSAAPTAARTTPPPARPFKAVMDASAGAVVTGAEATLRGLPGGPVLAAAVRSTPVSGAHSAEGSAGTASGGSGAGGAGGERSQIEGAMEQHAEQNLYYLELQSRIAAESRAYSAMSNVLKARHDTVKNAIGNIR